MQAKRVAILGSGPAGLMAAFVAAQAGLEVTIFEKRRGSGRQLLIAGSSGLNITYDAPIGEFIANYAGSGGARVGQAVSRFTPQDWIAFIESLGIQTFKGTSRRWFVEGMKASQLLRSWIEKLQSLGARLENGRECVGFERIDSGIRLDFATGEPFTADAVCFCLGGGSYEPDEVPLRWPAIFTSRGLGIAPFEAANVGYQVGWSEAFLKEAEGKPIKNVVLTSSRGSRSGDLVVTRYGVEGTPVYFAGEVGEVFLDLKPDLTELQLLAKLGSSRENLSAIRRVKKYLKLSEAALALIYHHSLALVPALAPAPDNAPIDPLKQMAALIKRFPLRLRAKQPLAEAISSSGGLMWKAVSPRLMLRDMPGVFVAGEMLDWDAPTGGFLIQACVSLGHEAGEELVAFLRPS
jgi:uncharacterized flavoprotein (TIGR03862 family)